MQKLHRAFTLIELLVVIAIIAILAAILFPVFAQAKVAAKKAVSISNQKQISLGVIMYQNDNDDMFPKNGYTAIGQTVPFQNPEVTWVQAVQPYIKNYPIFRDPGGLIDPLGVWANGSPYSWYYNWQSWPEYGMNTDYLNPASCSAFGTNLNQAYTDGFGNPISSTAVASPAHTVFGTTVKVVGSSTGAYSSITSESPGAINDPNVNICDYTNGGWGIGSYGDSPGLYPGNPTSTGTYATHYQNGGIVGWVDGHATFMLPGNLAAGTNWQVGITNTNIVITDPTQYVWWTQQ